MLRQVDVGEGAGALFHDVADGGVVDVDEAAADEPAQGTAVKAADEAAADQADTGGTGDLWPPS